MKLSTGLQVGLLVAAGACGKIPDATDGGADQPDAKPQIGKASLVVTHDDGLPVAAATVVHAQSDGSFIEALETRSDGRVEVDITAGDILHVGFVESDASGGASSGRVYTVFGIEVGDEVLINNRRAQNEQQLGQVLVNVQALPVGATSVDLEAGCTSGHIEPSTSLQAILAVQQECLLSSGKFAIVALARDANGTTVGSVVRTDVDPPPPNGQTTVDLPAWTVTPTNAPQVTFTVANVPDGVSAVRAELSAYREKLDYESFEFSGGASGASLQTRIAPGYADTLHYNAGAGFPAEDNPNGTDGIVFVVGKSEYSDGAATLAVDLSKSMPRIYAATYDSVGQQLAWSVSAADQAQTDRLAAADVLAVTIEWMDGSIPHQWQIIAPGTVGSPLELELHDLAVLGPPSAAGTLPASVQALDVDLIDGYTDLKSTFGTRFFDALEDEGPFSGVASFSGEGPR